MPLLRKKPFVPIDLPPDLKADEEVFLNILTKEIFRDYEEYFRRSILCNSLVWTCESTGRSNLTLSEAMQSEAEATEHLQKMPVPLQRGICYIIHKQEIPSLTVFVDEVLVFYRTRFLVGEHVEIAATDKSSGKKEGLISEIVLNPESAYNHPNQIVYKCELTASQGSVSVTGDKLTRSKTQLTRERVKLLAKCSAKKVTIDPPLYAIKPDYVERLSLDDENFNIPFVSDYGKPVPKLNSKRKHREDEEDYLPHDKKKSKKKVLENGGEEPMMSAEMRRKVVEEERARKRKEKQEERDNQKKQQSAEQAFQKEWAKPREDLELLDSSELPDISTVTTALPISLFGDMLQVVEFFHLFGEHVDLQEDFPDGVNIGELEKSLVSNKQESMFGDLVIFLLKLVFALQEEEDEEEAKLAERYNCTYVSPALDLNTVKMIPSVGWQTVMGDSTSDTLSWTGAAQAHNFTHYYLGVPLKKVQLDMYTVTEILRLHILGAGGRANGNSYYGRWRFNNRGMFSDLDDPCVELRKRDPSLVSMLGISNIYDLPPASKLTILHTFINQLLTYAQFREIIEEAFDGAREAKKEWKSFGLETQRKEKEESAQRYKEWVASRIKIKKKKKGRVTDVEEENGENDVSLAAENVDECPERTEADRAEEKKLQELQDHTLYIAFREISCKLNVNKLGSDRYYRKYWSFHSVPGIFVEASSLDVARLYPEWKGGEKWSSEQCHLTSASQLQRDMKDNSVVQENNVNETEYFVNPTDNLPVPGSQKSSNGTSKHVITIMDPSTMTVEEMVQLKLREASERLGTPPTSYSELCATRGFKMLKTDQAAWSHLNSESQIRDLISCLNARGEREKDLLESINKDLDRIINDFEIKPTLQGYDACLEMEEELVGDLDEEQKKAKEILKKASSEKLTEANLREQICDLENRIFEANFGAVKVKNRMTWRQEIEDFWFDDTGKNKKGDVPEIPASIVNQRLMALKASQSSSQQSNHPDDTSSLTSGSSTVVSRRSIIQKLSQALLSVQNGVPAKYLTYPLGETAVGRKNQDSRTSGELDQVTRWKESLENCTSLSQLLLHISTLDASIMWSRSILKANCRICRRKCDPDKLLLCDECDRGQHLYCLKPKLKSIPPGKWYCITCKPSSRSTRTRTKLVEISSEDEGDQEEEEDFEEVENDVKKTRSKCRSPKSLSEKLKLSHQLVTILREDENGWPFLYPVDAEQIPDYYRVIPNPMDLSTIEKKLKSGKYRKLQTFIDDVELIFLNCRHYNQSRAPASKAGVRLKKLFDSKIKEFGLS